MRSKVFNVHYSELEYVMNKWLETFPDNCIEIKDKIIHNINDIVVLVIFYTDERYSK